MIAMIDPATLTHPAAAYDAAAVLCPGCGYALAGNVSGTCAE